MCPPPQMYGSRAISFPAAITAWTAAGASIGATARPPGVRAARVVLGCRPLSVSWRRTSLSDVGCGRAAVALGLWTLTPADCGAGPVPPAPPLAWAAAPATGSIAWGWATGACPDAAEGSAAGRLDPVVVAWLPQPAHSRTAETPRRGRPRRRTRPSMPNIDRPVRRSEPSVLERAVVQRKHPALRILYDGDPGDADVGRRDEHAAPQFADPGDTALDVSGGEVHQPERRGPRWSGRADTAVAVPVRGADDQVRRIGPLHRRGLPAEQVAVELRRPIQVRRSQLVPGQGARSVDQAGADVVPGLPQQEPGALRVLHHRHPSGLEHVEGLRVHRRAQVTRPGRRLVDVVDGDVRVPGRRHSGLALLPGLGRDGGHPLAVDRAHRVIDALAGRHVGDLPAEQT